MSLSPAPKPQPVPQVLPVYRRIDACPPHVHALWPMWPGPDRRCEAHPEERKRVLHLGTICQNAGHSNPPIHKVQGGCSGVHDMHVSVVVFERCASVCCHRRQVLYASS